MSWSFAHALKKKRNRKERKEGRKIAFWPEKREGDLEGTAALPQCLAVAGGGCESNGKTGPG